MHEFYNLAWCEENQNAASNKTKKINAKEITYWNKMRIKEQNKIGNLRRKPKKKTR